MSYKKWGRGGNRRGTTLKEAIFGVNFFVLLPHQGLATALRDADGKRGDCGKKNTAPLPLEIGWVFI